MTIFDDELLVGRPNSWLGRWAIVYPELDGGTMAAGVAMFRKLKGKPGGVIVRDEDNKDHRRGPQSVLGGEGLRNWFPPGDAGRNAAVTSALAYALFTTIVLALVAVGWGRLDASAGERTGAKV